MAAALPLLALAAILAGVPQAAGPPASQPETIVDIRVHGNVATSDDEIRRIADVEIGSPLEADTVETVSARLRAANRFQHVQVLKRFASISDPNQIILIIVVDEGRVAIQRTGDPEHPVQAVRAHGPNLLFLPVLYVEDGYGVTYGARFAIPDLVGARSRLAFPATWGGEKRAAAELEKYFDGGVLTRLITTGSISRRTHPFYHEDEDREGVSIRGERDLTHSVHLGATGGVHHVSFLGADDRFADVGADVVVDTRVDPLLARNAIYARAAWDHVDSRSRGGINRNALEARGYIGFIGQSVLVVRALREDADRPLPPYLQSILGGLANLRGFRAGTAVGDTLVVGSAEVRLPLTSPLQIGRVGVSAFVDTGTVYNTDARLADQNFRRGVGGGVWFAATVVRFNVIVAHGIGAYTRVHFGGSLAF